MLGQPASWQTVCRPSLFTRFCIFVYSGPIFARVLIHSGLRSMGVWLLRTSRRSILRPSGATADTVDSLSRLHFLGEHQPTPVDSHLRPRAAAARRTPERHAGASPRPAARP